MNEHSLHTNNRATCTATSAIKKLCAYPAKLSQWNDGNLQGLAPLFLRLLLAYEFGEAGLEKLNGDNWFADLTFPFPVNLLPVDVIWTMAVGLEIIAPLALILGFPTRFFSATLMLLTIVAIAAVHWPVEWRTFGELWKATPSLTKGYGNFKLPLMYLLMLATLLFSGAGRVSIDAWLSRSRQAY
ncbi:MAG: HvfX family Cu-binding RiPP maturation protein [Methylobacter sp.]